METLSALLTLCAGNSPVPVNSQHRGQWRGALMFSLICARINDWVNNREAVDLRRHHGHYDVNVMGGSTLCWHRDPFSIYGWDLAHNTCSSLAYHDVFTVHILIHYIHIQNITFILGCRDVKKFIFLVWGLASYFINHSFSGILHIFLLKENIPWTFVELHNGNRFECCNGHVGIQTSLYIM